jgi:hypothetical protein
MGTKAWIYLKVFLASGPPFGLLFGLVALLAGGPRTGLIVGLLTGLAFGVPMALIIGSLHIARIGASGPGEVSGGTRASTVVELPMQMDRALHQAAGVLQSLGGFQIEQVDVTAGVLTARSGMTATSWGEQVTIEARPGPAGTALRIQSRPSMKLTLIDYGRNADNVRRIAEGLATPYPAR